LAELEVQKHLPSFPYWPASMTVSNTPAIPDVILYLCTKVIYALLSSPPSEYAQEMDINKTNLYV